ncbi:MAG: cell division protein FtsZ [Clostridiales bacterium]|jgi:cell division protein FtsZ|nr:cell division protein FtsZ [Clostridiales bacterium]
MAFTLDNVVENVVSIKVIGVGGAGNNVVSRMVSNGVQGIKFVSINTDKPTLDVSGADIKVQIGKKITRGQGAGSNPEIGRRSAEESRNAIEKVFEDTDMAFITAGMGGGTGTGAAPIVAELAREAGVLTIGVVTKPFKFEGAKKMKIAEAGVKEMLERVDTLLVIPNEKLKEVSNQKVTFANAFDVADNVLLQAVIGIADLLRNTSFINLDFADLKTIMKGAGYAHMGVGAAAGRNKIEEASQSAIHSPLMETTIEGARRVLVNVTGSMDITMEDVESIVEKVHQAAHPDANIIFGCDFDTEMSDAVKILVIATDFATKPSKRLIELSQSEASSSSPPKPVPEAPDRNAEPQPQEPEKPSMSEDGWDELAKFFNND